MKLLRKILKERQGILVFMSNLIEMSIIPCRSHTVKNNTVNAKKFSETLMLWTYLVRDPHTSDSLKVNNQNISEEFLPVNEDTFLLLKNHSHSKCSDLMNCVCVYLCTQTYIWASCPLATALLNRIKMIIKPQLNTSGQ